MFTDVIQHGVNGLIMGAVVALPALGLTLIFSVLGFVNFSIAAQMTVGAYAGWLVNSHWHWPLVPALAAAFVVAGLIGILGDRLALVPMRRRSTAHTSLMVAIASIALNLVLENGLRFGFGSDLYSYDLPIARDVRFGDIRVGPQQINNLGIALVIAIGLAAFFSATRWGKAMRAVADNVDLARLKGIDPRRLSNLATFIGMGLAGIGGALLAIDTSVDPSTGSRLLLVVFAASVVGGLTSLPGAVLGALLIGVVSEVALSVVSPVYQSATAFVAILLVLLVRPNGLFSGVSGIRK
jgi:branched-subunit amino acid ABC-type transport system permease component